MTSPSQTRNDDPGNFNSSNGRDAVEGSHGAAKDLEKQEQDGQRDGKGKQTADKGKGKEDSFVNRLQASTQLAAKAITAGRDLPDILPTEKAPTGFVGSASQRREEPGEASQRPLSAFQAGEALGPSIRRTRDTQEPSHAFEEFVHGAHPSLVTDHNQPQRLASEPLVGQSVAQQELSDGSAVLQLLSHPDDIDELAEQQSDTEMSPATAARLRAALFESDSTRGLAWDDLLNFTPDFLYPGQGPLEVSTGAEPHLGIADISAARDIWLEQWSDVLSSYNDHVWGDLGPLAARAKDEIQQLSSTSSEEQGQQTKALDRLKQILLQVQRS